jgi:hypothetical protein
VLSVTQPGLAARGCSHILAGVAGLSLLVAAARIDGYHSAEPHYLHLVKSLVRVSKCAAARNRAWEHGRSRVNVDYRRGWKLRGAIALLEALGTFYRSL